MSDDEFPKKSYCYKSDCEVVITGFHLEQYYSCKKCKMELTERLYNQIKERDDKKDQEDDLMKELFFI